VVTAKLLLLISSFFSALVGVDRKEYETQLFGTTDKDGRCTIIAGPGEYLVFTLPPGVQSSTLQKNEIEERATTAQRVSLKPAERKTFDLLMRPIK
jgi:hypothetical protein